MALGALPATVRAVTVRLIPERNVEVQMWSDLLAYATLEMLPGFCTQRGVPIAPGRDQMLLWMDSPGTLRPAFPAPIRATPAINCRYVWAHTRDGWRLLSDWARISIQWSPVVTGLLARRPQEALLEEFGPPEVVIFTGPRQRLHDNEPLPRVVSWTQIPVLVQYWRTGEGNEQLVFPLRPELEIDGARHDPPVAPPAPVMATWRTYRPAETLLLPAWDDDDYLRWHLAHEGAVWAVTRQHLSGNGEASAEHAKEQVARPAVPTGALTALSRKVRNVAQHALHGNVKVSITTAGGVTLTTTYTQSTGLDLRMVAARLLGVPWEGLRLVECARPFHFPPPRQV